MFLSEFSVKRPVAMVVIILALMALGLLALSKLRVNQLPDVEQPLLVVAIPYPGASPDTVEREIVNRLEKALQGISGVTDVRTPARWIPFTRMDAAARLRVGDTFAGITGPAFLRGRGLVDRMQIERLDPPARGRTGVAVYRKLGPVLLGTAEVHVRPTGRASCTVTWVERVHLRGLPARITRPVLSPVLAAMTSLALRTMAKEQRAKP